MKFLRPLLLTSCLCLVAVTGALASNNEEPAATAEALPATSAADAGAGGTTRTGGRAAGARARRRYTHTGLDLSTLYASGALLILAGSALRKRREPGA